jgi:hypothetical protein
MVVGVVMDKVVSVHKSFEEAARADKAYSKSLSPEERVDILLELRRRTWADEDAETGPRLERVYRIIKFS